MSQLVLIDKLKMAQSSEAAATTKTSTTMKLDRLPELILCRIFEFLLSAKEVRGRATSDTDYVIKYLFQTNIMRVNKSIHFLAQGVFRLNHFVLVSTNNADIMTALGGYHLQTWRDRLTKFKQYHARLNVRARYLHPSIPRKYHFFLICLEQIPEFTRILHFFELGNGLPWAFKFDIRDAADGSGSSMSLMRQRELLLPFTKIQGINQKCSVSGAVHMPLVKRIEVEMSPRLVWLRARAWAVYDAARHLKSLGDIAFQDGHFGFAFGCWTGIVSFFQAVQTLERVQANVMLVVDQNFHASIARLYLTTRFNLQLACLHLGRSGNKDWGTEGTEWWYEKSLADSGEPMLARSLAHLVDTDYAASQHFLGVAAFALGMSSETYQYFTRAIRLAPNNSVLQQSLEIVTQWKTISKRDAKREAKILKQRKQKLARLFELLPNRPLESPINLKYPVGHAMAFETYVLEELEYHGNKLNWLVELAGYDLTDPSILNREEADIIVKGRKEELEKSEVCIVIGALCEQPSTVPDAADTTPAGIADRFARIITF